METNNQLSVIAADFERWMPGVIRFPLKLEQCIEMPPRVWLRRTAPPSRPGDPFADYGSLYAASDWCDAAIAALIESAVLDGLERQEWDVWFQPGEATVCHPNRPQVTCDGPTRLARLHAACAAMFKEAPNGK
jgi:hypothetical protein